MAKFLWWWWFSEYICLSTDIYDLRVKIDKVTEYVIAWKPKRSLYKSKVLPLHGALLANRIFWVIVIQFNTTRLVLQQSNYVTKTVKAYIVYDLDNWSRIPLWKFTLKNYFFGATNIRKHNHKEKWVYSGYGIVFDGNGEWEFSNAFARNVHHFILIISRTIFSISWGEYFRY